MRLDGVLLFWGAVGVAVLWATSPAGPWWPPVAALVTATLFLWANWPARVPKQVECRPAVLIPTHNNRGEVGKVVEAALRHGLPVYVVDDGSKDGSGAEAAAAGATVVVHPVNHGKGRALLTGMEALQKVGCTH
ncbi:MAG TPA: glycosyltransferase, partial [Myxococcota bacterium]|nr:glycosyltransferase [Myxococcota bacterium]